MRQTSYYNAVYYWKKDIILCNNIVDADESIYENIEWEQVRHHDEVDDQEDDESDDDQEEYSVDYKEIYQWYLTDFDEYEVRSLQRNFGLLFSHSNKLDLWVLCVTHLGSSWHNVVIDVYNDEIADKYLIDEQSDDSSINGKSKD